MSDEKTNVGDGASKRGDSSEQDRSAILERRRRLINAALVGAGIAASAACEQSQVCLSIALVPQDVQRDASDDLGPQVCLSVQFDMRDEAAAEDLDASPDVEEPQICLSAPLPDMNDTGDIADDVEVADAADADATQDAAGDLSDVTPDADADLQDANEMGPQICLSVIPPDMDGMG